MNDKKTTYPKKVIEIADYIFANPVAKRKDILAMFGDMWRTPDRTMDRIWKRAKEYNDERIQRNENVKEETEVAEIKEAVKRDIGDKFDKLELLWNKAKGGARKVATRIELIDGVETPVEWEIVYPSDGDSIRAISEMNKMQGDYAPEKKDITTGGESINCTTTTEIIFKNYDGTDN